MADTDQSTVRVEPMSKQEKKRAEEIVEPTGGGDA
jgi:hypothetical protein